MATTEQLTEWLSEAEAALHALVTGAQEVRIRYKDKEVQYTQASIAQLRGYISDLKAQLGQGRPARARRIVFG